MTWGLPSQGSKTAAPAPAPSSPAAPAWGSGDAGPKRTLKQIQEEEEKRKVKLAAQQRASQSTPQPGSVASAAVAAKRVYADLAANATSAQPAAGWTTIGSSGKPSGTLPAKPTVSVASVVKPAASVIASPSVTQPAAATKNSKSNGSDDFSAPSIEFLRWVKTALTGLNAPIDEFVQMLLSFPIDPPASQRPEILEIISDSVYASSSTLDGRRFAQEFYTKRKTDALRPKDATAAAKKVGSLAEVVKAVPKKAEDAGFKIVKAKGKKKN
ncbi:hypothetical protein BCR39DRAFT_472033 [Naematelia encephala]|uniref:Uncharacterized protein n=1 Tax=Naematelia encephala TaxID=71784 RepID=A0A1Y2ARB9_9TREE|nr:hypothetical protein BCR39DRAFT_472033 [Naematelia encephala]